MLSFLTKNCARRYKVAPFLVCCSAMAASLLAASAWVTGRWHDGRHTFITDLAESGQASDETIRDMAGHVSKQMLKHYSHIRMEAKRRAVDALVKKPTKAVPVSISDEHGKELAKVERLN